MKGLKEAVGLIALVALLASVTASCGDDADLPDGGGAAAQEAGGTTPAETKCGAGTGEKASGAPIKVGALVTKIPGADLTDVTDGAKAFFDCVNDNGGISGRPIDYAVDEDALDPQQTASKIVRLADPRGCRPSSAARASSIAPSTTGTTRSTSSTS
jgi:branched-chain amino acid transport system substrate-binding protein